MRDVVDQFRPLLVAFLLFPIGAALTLRLPTAIRWPAFALNNLVFGLAAVCAAVLGDSQTSKEGIKAALTLGTPVFALYALSVLVAYGFLRAGRGARGFEAAFWFPILLLIVVKYVPALDVPFHKGLAALGQRHVVVAFIGISYVSFRLAYLAREVQNGVVPMPSAWQYLAYAFYVPTMSVGPISPYSRFHASIEANAGRGFQRLRAAQRIALGLVKYTLFSGILGLFGYSSLMLDGHPHAKIDLVIAVLAYPLYLFCNFSGLCDVVIGVSALIGVSIMENFDQPFASRNFQEFWSRWHISLSAWFRDMMFTPMVKALTRRFGPKNVNHVIAVSILSVFTVLGVWHGATLNYLLFGISQGIGVVVVHYSTIFMKKRLGKVGFQKYRANKACYVLGVTATYLYFALTMILFANSLEQIGRIFHAVV